MSEENRLGQLSALQVYQWGDSHGFSFVVVIVFYAYQILQRSPF